MKLSVIIPVYNAENIIEDCLNSVMAALPESSEIIVVDDGSTDDSALVARAFKRDEKAADVDALENDVIRVVTTPHLGVANARNEGLKAAKGEYISFVDVDDRVKPEIFHTMLYHIGEEVDLVCVHQEKEYENGTKFNAITGQDAEAIYLEDRRSAFYNLFYEDFGSAVWGRLFKRSLIVNDDGSLKIQFPSDLSQLEDLCFLADYVAAVRGKVVRLSAKLYVYRIADNKKPLLRIAKEVHKGYMHLIKVGQSISSETGKYMEITYTERLSRLVAKLTPEEVRSTKGQKILNRYCRIAKKVIGYSQVSPAKKAYYVSIGAFPRVSGVVLQNGVKLMRDLGLTID